MALVFRPIGQSTNGFKAYAVTILPTPIDIQIERNLLIFIDL